MAVEEPPDRDQRPPEADVEEPEAPRAGGKREHSWVLTGSLLGGAGTLLAAIVSAASLFADGGENPPTTATTVAEPQPLASVPYARPFAEVRDETRQLYLAVPNEWEQRDRRLWSSSGIPPFRDGTILGPAIIAAPDIKGFLDDTDFTTPGIFAGASTKLPTEWTPLRLIEEFEFGFCEAQPKRVYSKPSKVGASRTHRCPGTKTEWHVEAWWPPDTHSYIVLVQAKLVTERDHAALDAMLAQLDVSLERS